MKSENLLYGHFAHAHTHTQTDRFTQNLNKIKLKTINHVVHFTILLFNVLWQLVNYFKAVYDEQVSVKIYSGIVNWNTEEWDFIDSNIKLYVIWLDTVLFKPILTAIHYGSGNFECHGFKPWWVRGCTLLRSPILGRKNVSALQWYTKENRSVSNETYDVDQFL